MNRALAVVAVIAVLLIVSAGLYNKSLRADIPFDGPRWRASQNARDNMSKALLAELRRLEKDPKAQNKILEMLGPPDSQEALGAGAKMLRYSMERSGYRFEYIPSRYFLVIEFDVNGALVYCSRRMD